MSTRAGGGYGYSLMQFDEKIGAFALCITERSKTGRGEWAHRLVLGAIGRYASERRR